MSVWTKERIAPDVNVEAVQSGADNVCDALTDAYRAGAADYLEEVTRLRARVEELEARQVVPDCTIHSRAADLIHLLRFAKIETATPGDDVQANIAMKDIEALLTAAPTQPAVQATAGCVTVSYDTSSADTDDAIRAQLIAMGWTPPAVHARLSFEAIEECYPDDDAFEHVPAQAMYEFARAVERAVHGQVDTTAVQRPELLEKFLAAFGDSAKSRTSLENVLDVLDALACVQAVPAVPEAAAAVIAEMKAAAWCEQSDAHAWADRLERAQWTALE